jgi:hypothetical protein
VGLLVLIDAFAAVAGLAIWYFCFARLNRRKGDKALRSVEAACGDHGRVVETRWVGSSRVQAQLRFAAHWFENACITIRLLPRPMPVRWLLSLWRREQETLTFEADLDCPPNLRLDVLRHRWLTHSHLKVVAGSRDWMITRPGPVVLTTRTQWTQELPPIVSTLMTSRGHSLVSVRFRPQSPHLAATVALDALSDEDSVAGFLGVLRDLAARASTSTQ